MFVTIIVVHLGENWGLRVVTKNYLQYSHPKVILFNTNGEILLSEHAITEICGLSPKLNKILSQICVRGCISYYIADESYRITCVELERLWDLKKLRFKCTWAIETYGFFANFISKLAVTRKQLRLLYKSGNRVVDALELAHIGMSEINELDKTGKRPKVHSLAMECKWCVLKHLKTDEYLPRDILDTLPKNVQLFLEDVTFLE